MPVLRAERVIAVRHRPISALGARGWAFLLPIGGADVRLFGGKGEIPPAREGNHASTGLWTTKLWKHALCIIDSLKPYIAITDKTRKKMMETNF